MKGLIGVHGSQFEEVQRILFSNCPHIIGDIVVVDLRNIYDLPQESRII